MNKFEHISLYDLHRHLGGCITPETVWELIKQHKQYNLARSLDEVRKTMTFRDGEEYGFYRFLDKFDILNAIRWNEDSIDMMINGVVRGLRDEGLDYAEIHFSVDKYMSHLSWNEIEVCMFIIDRFKYWCKTHIMPVGLVLSVKYGSPREEQKRIQQVIDSWQVAEHLVGIDIVGDESHFDLDFYEPIFRHWRLSGKGLTIHVGESVEPSRGVINVHDAITRLKVHRIAHGIHCVSDPSILQLAKDHKVAFDIAFTSNLKTGIVPSFDSHPAAIMYSSGCMINIGTDDPVVLGTNILNEYKMARKILSIESEEDLQQNPPLRNIMRNSIESSFVRFGPSWLHKLIKLKKPSNKIAL